jgi:intracellular multiplication protein IcmO
MTGPFAKARVRLPVLKAYGEAKVTNEISQYPLLDQLTPVPGTDSGGKRGRLLDILRVEIAQGSGLVLLTVEPELARRVAALARESGRGEEVRSVAFASTRLVDQTTAFNPFATTTADGVRLLLENQLGEPADADPRGVFRARAVTLVDVIAPALIWLRDIKGVPLDIECIRSAMELRWISRLANERIALLRDPHTEAIHEIDVAKEIPEDVVRPLRCYLGELPGYDPARSLDEQKHSKACEQHGYAQFYFTPILSELAGVGGQTLRVDGGDVDMRVIVANRGILVVSLPGLEDPDSTLVGLGKLIVVSLQHVVAQLDARGSGGSLSTTCGKASSRLLVVLHDAAGRVARGLDSTAATGRSLNIGFVLTVPDVEGIWMSPWAQAA